MIGNSNGYLEIDQAGLARAKEGRNYGQGKWAGLLDKKGFEIIEGVYTY